MNANRVLMHRDQWTGVSPEGQKIWDQLSEEDKAVILKKMPTSTSTKPSRSTIRRKPNSHKVNIHETSVYDFIMANAHQLDYGEQGTNIEDDTSDVEDTDPPDDEAQTLHAFLASHGNDASPADLHNVLSMSSKGAADKPRQANTHLTYTVGKHHADKPGALINRGANGGVAGADVRVIEITHCAVNIQGVSDHQVTDLKLDYGEQGTDVEDDTSDVEDTDPPDDEAQTFMHSSLVMEMMPHQPISAMCYLRVPNVLQTSPVRPTPTLPTPWASIMLTNPGPSSIKVQMVV